MLFKHNGKKHFNIILEDEEPVGDINSIFVSYKPVDALFQQYAFMYKFHYHGRLSLDS